MEQTVGAFLANFMPVVFQDPLNRGFSGHSEEACHEFMHGVGTCTFFLARDSNCKGKDIHVDVIYAYKMSAQ